MNFLSGFILAIIGLIAASIHLKQGAENYWDFVAFAVVFCGTVAVLIMSRPRLKIKFLVKHFGQYLFGGKKDKVKFTKNCFQVIQSRNADNLDRKEIENKILRDGLEMIELGFDKDRIEEILSDRYVNYKKLIMSIAQWLKRTAKYPPAFGLAGTVLGLIHLMKGISSGADPKETGIRMAVALVATFYGLIMANFVLNPASENIAEKLKADEELVEIAIKCTLMIKDNYNLIEAQEMLNSYLLDENEKINFMDSQKLDDSIEEMAA